MTKQVFTFIGLLAGVIIGVLLCIVVAFGTLILIRELAEIAWDLGKDVFGGAG